MKTDFLKTDYYSFQIDKEKNRIYFAFIKKWKGIEDFPDFIEHWEKVIDELQPNFTVNSDLRVMPILSKEVEILFSQLHYFVMDKGLFRVAEVISMNDISYLQLSRISERSELPQNKFRFVEDAEQYLDKLVISLEK